MLKGPPSNPDALIYRFEPDQSGAPLLFLAGDSNVLFFLGKNFQLLTGDANFSYTMNRR